MPRTILNDQKEYERIGAMANVFRKMDRVLTGESIDVEVEDSSIGAPSWTDGRTITFNRAVIGSVTSIDDIIRLSGLNYHELAHCWYTPRHNTALVKSIRAEGLFDSFNILEDQRIETFLTSKYPSTIPYLVSTFMRFCITSDRAWTTNYALVYGRKFIPADVRAEFKRRFLSQSSIPALEAIIDEYRTLVYPKDADRGLELTRQFAALLQSIGNPDIQDPHGHVSGGRPDSVSAGRPAPQREQQDVADSVEDMDEELEARDEERRGSGADSDVDDDDVSDDAEGGDGSGDDASDSDGDSDGGSNGGGIESDPLNDEDLTGESSSSPADSNSGPAAQHDGDDESVSGGGQGSGGVDTSGLSDKEMRDMLQDVAESFENMPDVQEEASNRQKAIVNGNGDVQIDLDAKRSREYPVRDSDISLARRFASILDQLRAAADPGWLTRTSSGKVNMQRVIGGADYDKVWDRWQEGNSDAADIECVITIDTSGSMAYSIDNAARAMWVIKRAMEIIDANVTVIAYNDSTSLVYKKEERVSKRAYRTMKATGSTMPRKAIVEAVRILQASRRHNKIFITITDGQWGYGYGPTAPERMIEALNDSGVTTALAFIGYAHNKAYIDGHKCKVVTGVNDPMELVGFARQIVETSMKER